MSRTIFFGLLALLLCCRSALANGGAYVDAQLLCSDSGAALLQFSRVSNEDERARYPELPTEFAERFDGATIAEDFSCDVGWENHPRPLRVKIGIIPGRHYGSCGGATKYFFSMWIDQRRILTRHKFHNPCTGFENLDLVYYSGGTLVFCASEKYAYREGRVTADDLRCIDVSDIFRACIADPIDRVEYPVDGSYRREGHVVLWRTENPELCAYLHTQFQHRRGLFAGYDADPVLSAIRPLDGPRGPMGKPGPFRTDINNDGLIDLLAVRMSGPGSIGEELVMLVDGRDGLEGRDFTDPLDFGVPYDFPPIIPVRDTIFAEGLSERSEPYVLLTLFDWKGTSYVLMSPMLGGFPDWAVYKVNQDNTYSEICVLDRVAIHY